MSGETRVLANWNQLLDGVSFSTQDFYSLVEQAVKAREVPDIEFGRVDYKTGHFFSSRREYLRVKRGELSFQICGAPFGTGFFVSWWLTATKSGFGALFGDSSTGSLFKAFVNPETYFKQDSAAMYRAIVAAAVNEAVDAALKGAGKALLSDEAKRPVLEGFYN
jgi:hypothetical protein